MLTTSTELTIVIVEGWNRLEAEMGLICWRSEISMTSKYLIGSGCFQTLTQHARRFLCQLRLSVAI